MHGIVTTCVMLSSGFLPVIPAYQKMPSLYFFVKGQGQMLP